MWGMGETVEIPGKSIRKPRQLNELPGHTVEMPGLYERIGLLPAIALLTPYDSVELPLWELPLN